MRILVEPSDYTLHNAGDMAMLHTALARLRENWPNSVIQVLTNEPGALNAFCPHATPLATAGRRLKLSNDYLPIPARMVPQSLRKRLGVFRRHAPVCTGRLLRLKLKLKSDAASLKALAEFDLALKRADLVIVTGMGGITDAFESYAMDMLDSLCLAHRCGKFTAMVGQGFGPIVSPPLLTRARQVLPRVNFISLREDRASRPLLLGLGVSPQRIMTTGDDAIEMAHSPEMTESSRGIGINLRISGYSGVEHSQIPALTRILNKVALDCETKLIPVPISSAPSERDAAVISFLIGEGNGVTSMATPESVIHQVRKCRVVVTGSYHAAVFALANGVPVLGLARSSYYVDKFKGLAAMFGSGCETVLLHDEQLGHHLPAAIRRMWDSADAVRPHLLQQASVQIESSRKAYARLKAEVEEHLRCNWRAS